MANIEACILKLRLMGYKAKMVGKLPLGVAAPMDEQMYDILGDRFVVRCQGFTVSFNEHMGLTINPVPTADPIEIMDRSQCSISITYPFENQSFFLA